VLCHGTGANVGETEFPNKSELFKSRVSTLRINKFQTTCLGFPFPENKSVLGA
jgi:hypothetical protein